MKRPITASTIHDSCLMPEKFKKNRYVLQSAVKSLRRAICFVILICLTVGALGHEVVAQERVLVLENDMSSIPMASYMGQIDDTKSRLTSQAAMQAYDRGEAQYQNIDQTRLSFGVDGAPTWFVLNIRNESDEEEFIFSLIKDLFHSQGTIENAILFGTNNRDEKSSVKINTSYLKVNIPKNRDITLLFYVNPADYIPLVLTPYVSSERDYFFTQDASKDGSRAVLFLFLGMGFAAFLAYVLKSAKFIPYFVAYAAFGVFLVSAKIPLMEGGFIAVLQPFLLFIMMSFMALGVFLQNSITFKDKSEILSVGLPYALMVICGIIVVFLPEGFGLMNVILMIVPAVLFCVSFAILSLAYYQDGYKSSIWTCLSWLFIGLSLIFFLLNGLELLTSFEYMPLTLPYVVLKGAIVFLFVSVVMTPTDTSQQSSFDFSVLPTSIKNLKEAEEEGEYNRLLTVVERERQMMAELRQIDVRRRKDMQRAKESADEANRAKSAFLAVISHEIRTPMTGIMGLVRLLMDTPLSDEQKKYSKSIMESGESMTLLLNDILDFEKIETGKMALEENFFNVKDLVQSTATLMAGHAQTKKIYLKLEISPDVPLEIRGDAPRLRQVLLNLLGNAIKFTEQGGVTIHIRPSKRMKPTDENSDLYPFSIAIEDTGIGIPQQALEDLFNPFSQASTSIAGKYGGSGLGLAICQRLIELMGGKIKVESAENKGSRFSIHLLVAAKQRENNQKVQEFINYTNVNPLEIEEDQLPMEQTISEIEEHNMADDYEDVHNPDAIKIMVVEDNLVSQQVIETFLKKLGHEVMACSNAEDALILAKDEKFDLVFMDWELPGMSGPEAIRAMKSDPSLYIKYTVLLTGHRVTIEETGLKKEELSGILNKPVMPEHLEDMIASLDITSSQDMNDESADKEENSAGTVVARNTEEESFKADEDKPTSWSYKASLEDERPAILQQLDAMNNDANDVEEETVSITSPSSDIIDKNFIEPPPHSLWENNFFDQEMISSLLETLGEEKVKELLESVFEKTDEILIDLQAALQENNIQEVNMRAHELKGMAGNFALSQIHDLSARLEENIKAKADVGADDLLIEIQKAHIEAKEALKRSNA